MSNPFPIFDGHNDTLLNLYTPTRGKGRSFFERSGTGHIDLPRAREGGFGGGFFAMFVPSPSPAGNPASNVIQTETGWEVHMSPPVEQDYAQNMAMAMMALLFRLEEQSEGQLQVIRTADQAASCLQDGTIAAVMHFEGAEAIDTDFNALEVLYKAGLRSLGPVWSRPNAFAHGVPFKFPHSPNTGPGLTDAGRALVRACNHLGILIDLSHMNEQGFWDVANISEKPLVATHSNAHALTPTTRNLTDRQLDAIRESEGMVGLNFSVTDLRDGNRDSNLPLEFMVRHLDYLIDRLGVDCVGFGSDFDGTTISSEIGDVTGLPKLIAALQEHGYDEATLRKITHENWLRVLRKTW